MRKRWNNLILQPNSRGVSLIETVIFCAIMGAIVLFASNSYLSSLRLQSETQTSEAIRLLRKQLQQSLAEETSWRFTLADVANVTLACLRNGTDCRDITGLIQVRDAVNGLVATGLNPKDGFTLKGLPCDKFDPDAPNEDCPFRYEVRWTPMCPDSGACTNPLSSFEVRLLQVGTKKFNYLDLKAFSFKTFHSSTFNYLEESCRAFTGNYDVAARECVLPKAGRCPGGFVVKAIYSEGGEDFKVCKAIEGSCPPGQFIDEIDRGGRIVCK